MDISILEVEIILPECLNLKQKRAVIKSLKDRIRNRFNVSIAEIDFHDLWGKALLCIVTVSKSRVDSDKRLNSVIHFIEKNIRDGYVGNISLQHI